MNKEDKLNLQLQEKVISNTFLSFPAYQQQNPQTIFSFIPKLRQVSFSYAAEDSRQGKAVICMTYLM